MLDWLVATAELVAPRLLDWIRQFGTVAR